MSESKQTIGVILAAGKGTRMQSTLPKPLVNFDGKPIVQHIIDALYASAVDKVALIVGHGANEVRSTIGSTVDYIFQLQQLGTAHAVMQATNYTNWNSKNIIVFVGDAPLITSNTIEKLICEHNKQGAACTFLTSDFPLKLPYARVVRDRSGILVKCVEEKDATPKELAIKELLTSHFIFNAAILFKYLPDIKPDLDNGELYLTDIIDILLKKRLKIIPLKINDYQELVGLNTPEDLTWASNELQIRSKAQLTT